MTRQVGAVLFVTVLLLWLWGLCSVVCRSLIADCPQTWISWRFPSKKKKVRFPYKQSVGERERGVVPSLPEVTVRQSLDAMEAFCHGQWWNTTLLMDNTWPQFTDCFLHTALIWLPCSCLFLSLPFYVTSVRRNASDVAFKKTTLFGARQSCCLMLAILSLLHLTMRVWNLSPSNSPAAFLGDALYITAYITLCVMTQYERVMGVPTSAVPFLFWIISSLCNVIPLYTSIIQKRYISHTVSFTLLLMSHCLQLCSLFLTAFVSNRHVISDITDAGRKPCPLITCSLPSYLTFCWMTRLMVKGYKRGLQSADLWELPSPERSDTLTSQFLAPWAAELQRHRATSGGATSSRTAGSSAKSGHHGTDPEERTPLLAGRSSPSHKTDSSRKQEEGKRAPRLLRTLLRMMVKDLAVIVMVRVMSDVFFLVCPLLMGLLMDYLSTPKQPGRQWQGYTLCGAMLVALVLKSLLFTHSMFQSARVGIRMKSTLIAAIYRKAVTMSGVGRREATVGEVVNLMAVDAQRVQDAMIVCFYAATGPLQFVVAVVLLYFTIGPAIFVGVLLFLCCLPLNAYVISRQRCLQSSNLGFKDARIRLFHEILSGIKVLKLYAWEPSFRQKIREIRQKEVSVLFKMALLNTLMSLCWEMVPFLVTLVTLMTYVLLDENNRLDAGKAFVSLSLFNILRQPLAVLSRVIMYIILVQVSIKRISKFLTGEDLDPDSVNRDTSSGPVLSVQNGTFTWNLPQSPVLKNINLQVAPGKLVAVVGPVGCGKSSLISAMLGEMAKVKGAVTSRGRVAYVPQLAWIQNATLRDNILFGRTYIRSRYRGVLDLCQLGRDVAILPAGDLTEIGEKGINLSGGQKQRVSVARAVYSDSDVYLLDDPLSAVDSHVGKAIFSKVFSRSGILRKKTRVLVTHGIHWLPMVDEVVVMTDGKISERGSYEQLMSHDGPFAQFLKNYLTEAFELEEVQEDPEIAEIHGRMRERLGSVTSHASSSDDSLKLPQLWIGGHHRRHRQNTKLSEFSDSFESSTHSNEPAHRRHSSMPPSSPPPPPRGFGRLHGGGAGLCDVEDSVTLSPTSQNDDADAAGEADGLPSCNTENLSGGGKMPFSVFLYYFRAVGLLPFLLAVISFCFYQALSVGANFWLKEWIRRFPPPVSQPDSNTTCHPIGYNLTGSGATANQTLAYNNNNNNNSSSTTVAGGWNETYFCLTIYGVFGVGQVLFLTLFNAFFWTRTARAARVLHERLADRLMHAPMSFFDTTPSGRVLNRLSFDVETVDTTLPLIIRDCLVTFVLVMVTVIVMMMHTPLSAMVLFPVSILCYFCQLFYVPSTRQLRRMECVSRSPIYVLFSETLGGAASIRAYDVTSRFLEESKRRVDSNQVFFFAYQAAVRWMQWNLDALAAVMVFAVCVFLVSSDSTTAADVGLCISYALQISSSLTWMTRQMGELQSNIVSVERLKEYSLLGTEAVWVQPDSSPTPHWPHKGEVVFEHFHTRYRPGLDLVLKGVSFTIRHGEKVGIVGRTGAGKSSLTLSLFRLIEAAAGSILIDGLNIADMGLHDLRSRLTILPQDPVLFSGSLRMNLDPFGEYDDQQLWKALERAHLKHFVSSLPGQLDFQCGEEGGDLSVGQRQLVCLARTLLRRTKILVLDEATAAVDMETDALIQDTIRSAFSSCTIITIAHRLNTIMDYDRVLVMDAGQVKEFAAPDELLRNKQSQFYAMAKDAGLM